MRKIGIGIGLILLIALIALAVRSQLGARASDDVGMVPVADSLAGDSQQAGMPGGLVDTTAAGAQPGMGSASAPPAATSPQRQRPVISGSIPTIVESPQTQAQAQDGGAVLKRAAAAYEKLNALRADFVQQRENALLGSTTTSRGTIYQRSPDRFLLKFSDPAGDVIVGDGRYFWIYYPSVDRRQVLRAPAGAGAAGGVDLRSQFLGDPLQRFQYVYHGTEKSGGRTQHVLTLTPRDAGAGYRTLKVWVDSQDYLARRFIITEPSGAAADFRLSNLTANPALADALFRFTPPADAHVVER